VTRVEEFLGADGADVPGAAGNKHIHAM
jgi:hypothetical protein